MIFHLQNQIKLYGPYQHKDGRKFVIYIDQNEKRKTQSLTRFLVEHVLNRSLSEDMEVDHIDKDCTNDSLSNLQLLPAFLHRLKDSRLKKYIDIICPVCGISAVKEWRNVKRNLSIGKSGPFCGKSCAGTFSTAKIDFPVYTYSESDAYIHNNPVIIGEKLSDLFNDKQIEHYNKIHAELVELGIHRALKQPRD